MRIRMRQTITGSFHNIDEGVVRGQVVDIDAENAQRYIAHGLAEAVAEPAEERAVVEPDAVETAVPVKRPVGRPKKQPSWDDEQAPG